MRSELEALMARFGFAPHGHAGKALARRADRAAARSARSASPMGTLERVATTMTSLIDRPRRAPCARRRAAGAPPVRLRAGCRGDAQSNRSCGRRVQAMLEAASGAPVLDWSLSVEGSTLALMRFVIDIRDGAAAPMRRPLDAALQALVRGWGAAVEAELAKGEDPSLRRGHSRLLRDAEAFPVG